MPALKKGFFCTLGLFVLGFVLALGLTLPPQAQSQEKDSQAKAPDMIIPAEQPSQGISATLQQALQDYGGGDVDSLVVLCGSACQPPGEENSSNPAQTWVKSGTYSCEGGSCSCEGAVNCVQMIGRDNQCLRSSTTCTEAGCSCNQRSRGR